MDERPVLDRIDELVSEEHELWSESAQGRLSDERHRRLNEIRGELDRCWDVLRRRRASPAQGTYPPAPDPPNELEGPEPEPPHLEHGVHTDESAPDPGVPRNIP